MSFFSGWSHTKTPQNWLNALPRGVWGGHGAALRRNELT